MARKIVSLTLLLSFILIIASSLALYVVPEGRVAYWSQWEMFGLSKEQWGALHIAGGFLFLLCGIWHLFLNLRPTLAYLSGKGKGSFLPLAVSLALCGTVYAGTLYGWQPMQGIMDLNSSIKRQQERAHGAPPYGHAELSTLQSFCGFMRFDVEKVVAGLREQGFKGEVKGRAVLADIAAANDMPPSELYRHILKAVGLTEEQARAMQSGGSGKGAGRGKKAE